MLRINRRSLCAAAGGAPFAACAADTPIKGAVESSLLIDLDRAPDFEIDLWPNGAPGGDGVTLHEHFVERKNAFGLPDRAAHDVTRPTLMVFRAREPDGSAILIIPGGGYKWVVVEKEGYEGARLFSHQGACVYVLKHRLPHQGWAAGPDTPLQDAQRAMRVIRARAAEDGVDPERIAVMGFSAGGHVAGSLNARFDTDVYAPVDDADVLSARPNLTALIYPVATLRKPFTHQSTSENMIGAEPSAALLNKYSLETSVKPGMPPTFLMHAADDDAVPVENSLQLFAALKAQSIPAAMHIFEQGGHGFGLRGIDNTPLRTWPELFWRFGAAHGVFGEGRWR